MSVSVIENAIDTVISSYQHTDKIIVEGSDEHLDLILHIQNDLKQMTALTKALVDALEEEFNLLDEQTAKDMVVKIFPCFRMAYQIISRLKKSMLYPGLQNTIAEFNTELDELKEFTSDLSRYKVQQNTELLDLFNAEM